MKDYATAVKFEKACQVCRLLEFLGKTPSIEDRIYINKLRHELDNDRASSIFEPWARESLEWARQTFGLSAEAWRDV